MGVASATALALSRSATFSGTLNAAPERPHSPTQLHPCAEVLCFEGLWCSTLLSC